MVNPDSHNFINILQSESFWVAVAFFIFIGLSFSKFKELLIKSLDNRIANVKKKIEEIKKIKEDAENNLLQSKNNLENIIKEKEKK